MILIHLMPDNENENTAILECFLINKLLHWTTYINYINSLHLLMLLINIVHLLDTW